ncbi:Phosphatidylserine synthase 1 [Exaiptasia diaphana]|nr:Phosphatidylserine synthase 1 [Exaiptasia diaphana]
MAEGRRKRTFSSCSTISSDDYNDASEQIVEDVTLEFFYKPRSLTALCCLFLYLVYSAFSRNPDATRDENIYSGVVSLIVVFLVLSFLVMPNGCSVLYLMFLSFALFQTREDFRKILFFFDPKLEGVGEDTQCYKLISFYFRDIHSTTGKIHRAVMQFTPVSWTHVRWMDPKCSYMRYLSICVLLFASQVIELNTFFLKHILLIPTRHWLNWLRIFLISLIVAPTLRQYYSYVTDTRSKRVGTQCWVFIAIMLMEALICIKYGLFLFKKTEITQIVAWLIFQLFVMLDK